MLLKIPTRSPLDEIGKIFIISSFKHFNEVIVGGVRAKPSLPPLQCSPPERGEGGRGREGRETGEVNIH